MNRVELLSIVAAILLDGSVVDGNLEEAGSEMLIKEAVTAAKLIVQEATEN